ncbi:MAG: hypothetical protein ACK5JD_12620, partial [Mangrovibacterium sp.]
MKRLYNNDDISFMGKLKESFINKKWIFSFLILYLGILSSPVLGDTYTVVNTNDSGIGSLRQAIINANTNPGADVISFNIPGDGPHIIKPSSGFPGVTGQVFINGYSQSGSTPATANSSAVISIGIDWGAAFSSNVIIFAPGSDGSQLSGISMYGAQDDTMVKVYGNTTTLVANVKISGNYFGIDPMGNVIGFYIAIQTQYAGNIQIGGPNPEDRNVISGGISAAIRLSPSVAGSEPISTGTLIQGNYIGTDISGL